MASLPLTDADIHMLRALFAHAHHHGRMTDGDHDRTVIILAAAELRLQTAGAR